MTVLPSRYLSVYVSVSLCVLSISQGTGASLAGEDDGENPVGFPSLATGELPLCNPSTVADDFEAVREVFKKAKVQKTNDKKHHRCRF